MNDIKKTLFLVFLFVLLFNSCTKENKDISISFNLINSVNEYKYKIDIIQKNQNAGDFVLFVLDPSSMLSKVVDEFDKLDSNAGITIIGVGYDNRENNRNRDYTPTKVDNGTGEANEFLQFISIQLFEELLARNIVNTNAVTGIIGHSLGGLAVGYAFCVQNDFFDNYISLSPVFFYDDYVIFEIEDNNREQNRTSQAKVFLGIGEMEDFGMANGFEGFISVLQQHYPNVSLDSRSANGSHMGTIKENIFYGLKHIIE